MSRYAALQYDPTPCRGCHYITGTMIACLGICKGMTCQEDADVRAELWARLPQTYATSSMSEATEAGVRADERERIAQAIEAVRSPTGLSPVENGHLDQAARIARGRESRGVNINADTERRAKADVWDEAVEAIAWCLDNGPADDALPYVAKHNPYRTAHKGDQ